MKMEYLRPELDYRLRFVVQEAWKFCRRGRRTVLNGADIFEAWRLVCGEVLPLPSDRAAPGLGLSSSRARMLAGSAGFGS
jgi:hypothetical protein